LGPKTDIVIRDAVESDEDFILALNAASTPAVAEMDAEDYRDIAGWAHRVLVAEIDGERSGFLILIRPGSAYPSDNYGWFEAKFDKHLYIDRIAVSEAAKGKGLGRAFYDEAARIAAKNGDQRLTCEVNVEPPNPQSMAFHERVGFRYLLSRPSRSGKVVAMLERPL
jgi:predicted GNAT superfamily acetyltransferase